jgi:hypothetical protein
VSGWGVFVLPGTPKKKKPMLADIFKYVYEFLIKKTSRRKTHTQEGNPPPAQKTGSGRTL